MGTSDDSPNPWKRVFEALADPAFIADRESGLVLEVNEATARAYGYVRDEMIGLHVRQFSTEPEATTATVRAAESSPAPRRHLRKDGSTFLVEVSSSAIEWNGRPAMLGLVRDVTRRVQLEKELRDSQELVTNAFHRSPLMLSVADLQTDRYLEVNDSFCARVGYTREEVLGHTAIELGMITPAEREELAKLLMAAPKDTAIEFTVRDRRGAPIYCRYWGAILQSSEGLRVFAAAEDVSAQKHGAQELDEALRRLGKLASRLPGMVYEYRLFPDGRASMPFVSEGIAKLYRITPDEVREDASVMMSRLHPDDHERVVASILASARDLTPWRDEYRVRFEDGTVRWLRGDAVPEREADGAVLWHGFITDTTARKEADEALRKADERFVLAMDATSDGLWDWDISTDSGYFSPGYYRMLGYDPQSFVASGQRWRELIHPDDFALAQQANTDCIEGRTERFEIEYRMRAKSGEWRWILGRGKCVARDAKGRALRLIGTHVDVTERKRLQAGLAQNDRLASMGLLAAGIAHEINNPLSYVLTSLEVLAEDLPKVAAGRPAEFTELLECAQSALEGTQRIRKISRSLSTFARVERTELTQVDLNAALETAVTMAHNEVKYRATLIKELSPVPLVLGSDGKLAQVFLNLLINAAHAIGDGHADQNRITVRTWAEGGQVYAEVRDTGHGIKPEHLERIFEPFFTTKKVGEGSGLGLSISRNIITEFGGDIRVESEVGRGTRMVVRLPAASDQVREPPAPLLKPVASTPRGRLLVVDDEEPIRRILSRVLGASHDVVTAASGREGKALLERDAAFDLILCDLMMPDLSGMELHAWLATHDPALARRVVFVSGGAFTPSAGEYLESVDNLKLDKPFDVAKLLALVAERVKLARAG